MTLTTMTSLRFIPGTACKGEGWVRIIGEGGTANAGTTAGFVGSLGDRGLDGMDYKCEWFLFVMLRELFSRFCGGNGTWAAGALIYR